MVKKLKITLISIIVLLTTLAVSILGIVVSYKNHIPEAEAAGTIDIYNADDLTYLMDVSYNQKKDTRYNVNWSNDNCWSGIVIALRNDINLSGRKVYPLGKRGKPFKGKFRGYGYVISGYNLDLELSGIAGVGGNAGREGGHGFFGYTDGADIREFILENFSTKNEGGGSSWWLSDWVGGLIGNAKNTVVCDVLLRNGSVFAYEKGNRGSQNAGGLIGKAEGGCNLLRVAVVDVTVTARAQDDSNFCNAGGLIGFIVDKASYNLTECYFYGELKTQTQYWEGHNPLSSADPYGSVKHATVGGLIGAADPEEVETNNDSNANAPTVNISKCWTHIKPSCFSRSGDGGIDNLEVEYKSKNGFYCGYFHKGKHMEWITIPISQIPSPTLLQWIMGGQPTLVEVGSNGFTPGDSSKTNIVNSTTNVHSDEILGDDFLNGLKNPKYFYQNDELLAKDGFYWGYGIHDNLFEFANAGRGQIWFISDKINNGFPIQAILINRNLTQYSIEIKGNGNVENNSNGFCAENKFYRAFDGDEQAGNIDLSSRKINYLGQSLTAEETDPAYEFKGWSVYRNDAEYKYILTANFKIKEYNIKLNKYSSNMESSTDNKGKFALNTDLYLDVAGYGDRYEFTVVYDTSIYCHDDGGYGWSINFWENLGDGYGSFDAIPARDGSLKISKLTGIRIGERVYKLAELGQDKDRRVQEFCRDDNRTITITPVFEYLTWSIDLETISTTGRGGVGSYKIEKKDNTDPGNIDENKIVIRVADGWTVKYYTGGVYPTLQLVNKGVTKYTLTVSPEDGYYAASKWRIKLGNSSQDISQNSNIALSGDATITAVLSPIVYNINYEYENSRNNISKITGKNLLYEY